MKGYMVVFFTQQNRRYQGKMLGEWIVDVAKEMGLRGATLCTGIEGFGHTGKLHSSHFFELADQIQDHRRFVVAHACGGLVKHVNRRLQRQFGVAVMAKNPDFARFQGD